MWGLIYTAGLFVCSLLSMAEAYDMAGHLAITAGRM